ncbi:very short patch repair endonuclease [Desulfoferula mesophila]|uniref:very short patch repair endonuclease n=1 Tax=Desulfoferula mesophila TaxID=3058419 RepID=UPI003312F9A1
MSPSKRSALMSRIRGKDTGPEMIVRRLVHCLGYRYRLHHKKLPGTPDLVFTKRKKALFVHGCFWHRHEGCKNAVMPKTRPEFWREKFHRNVERDRVAVKDLDKLGWEVLVVWECETKDLDELGRKLCSFLG